VTVWGLRLSAYLTWRNWGKGEDWRYRRMRERSPRGFPARSLVTVFWTQAVAAWGVGLPLLAAVGPEQPRDLGWLDWLGALLWAIGVSFEAIGDLQLARFKAAPRRGGGVLDTGLWRYTRHPNYFGDALLWWGLGLIGLAAGAWWSVLGPAGMTVFLVRVTGVTVTEEHMRRTREDAYVDYVRRTSSFIPLPPRR
jgi:steroid 5-alpha reductase family enzyme